MKKILLLVAAVCVAAIAWTGVAWGAGSLFSKKRTETHDVAGVRSVVVEVDHGDVVLDRGGRDVTVRAVRHWSFTKPSVERTLRDGVLTVTGHCNGAFFLGRCSTNVQIVLPAGVPVKVRSHVGDVTGRGLATPAIDAQTNVGDVHLALTRPASLRVNANVGDVRVDVPRGTYAVDANSDVGHTGVHGVVSDDRARLHIHANANVGDVAVHGHSG